MPPPVWLSSSVSSAIGSFFEFVLLFVAAIVGSAVFCALSFWLYSLWAARRENLPVWEANKSADTVPHSVRVRNRELVLATLYRLSNGSNSKTTDLKVVQGQLDGMDAGSLCRCLAFFVDAEFVEWNHFYQPRRRQWNSGSVRLTKDGLKAAISRSALDPESAAMDDLVDWLYRATRPVGTDTVLLSSAQHDLPALRHAILVTSLRLLARDGLVDFSPRDYELCEVGWQGLYDGEPYRVGQWGSTTLDRKVRLTQKGLEIAQERALWEKRTFPAALRHSARPVVGWGMSASDLATTKMIEWLVRAGGQCAGASVGAYVEASGLSMEEVRRSVRELMAGNFLVRSSIPLTGISDLQLVLTRDGRAFAESVRRGRLSSRAKRAACRDALLNWLYHQDGEVDVDGFLRDPTAAYYGVPFERDDLRTAWDYLLDAHLASPARRSGADLRGAITDEGVTVVDRFNGDAGEYEAQRGKGNPRITVRDSQGVNIASQSPGSYQLSAHNRQDAQQIAPGFEPLAQAVADILKQLPTLGLPAQDQEDVQEVANEVLGEVVQAEPNRGSFAGRPPLSVGSSCR